MQAAQPTLIITVDTELSNFPDSQGLWGRIGAGEWGVARLLDSFAELGIRATFFLDVYANSDDAVANQRRAAEIIVATGHDLQLHTHPAPAFDVNRIRLRDYTASEQEQIIAFGCERINDWIGRRPVLHRAGDWAANHDTLIALAKTGFHADFSACLWSSNCGIDSEAISGNGWKRIDGMLSGIGTCYRDRLTKRVRRLDIGGVSFREIAELLALRVDPLILTLHSFSLLKHNRGRTRITGDADYLRRFEQFCRAAQMQEGYQVVPAIEAVKAIEGLAPEQLPWMELPTTSIVASLAGIWKSSRHKLRF